MNILITGANGFIGKNLCSILSEHNTVVGIGTKDAQISGVEYFRINITDYESLEKLFVKYRFDAVYHLASVTFHDEIVNQKQHTLNINLKGTENLVLLFNKYCNNAKFIYASTGKVYAGGKKGQPIDEAVVPNPMNPLGKSKYLTEKLIDYYCEDNKSNNFVILRIFNVYGYGQRDSFVIPHIMKHIKENKVIPLGNINDYRDYIYIDDLTNCLSSVLKTDLSKQQNNIDIYNIGSGKAYSVKNILDIVEKLTGRKFEIEIKQEKIRKDEPNMEYSDSSKFKKVFRQAPKTDLEEGLRQILKKEGIIE